jgi:proteasome assembly chaperone (PAC2) family protein
VDPLVWDERPNGLRRPVLVAAFEGWSDAANAASDAAAWITRQFGATRCAWIEADDLFDFQSRRPTVELVDGVTRSITWPANELFAVPVDGRDLVVLRGVEPNLHWRTFCDAVLTVASETGCELVVTLGALLADVPHTRSVRVTGTATDSEMVARLGLERSRYEGPTGIVGVLHDSARSGGVASASLWAPVPHYVATPPNPLATRALLDRLGGLLGTPFVLDDLDALASKWRERVDEIVASDDDIRTYVTQLEERFDENAAAEAELPSGETLAAEFQRYLRDQPGSE